MVFSILDTPRSEAGDQTRFSAVGDLDFTNDDSILSPTKGGNGLVGQIRGMRNDMHTPRARPALGDRRNFASKNEFTPLLKSAAKNRLARGMGKENNQVHTPASLKPGYSVDSPALPFNSSVMIEDHTGSSLGDSNPQGTPAGPMISSSSASTPMAILPNRGEGPLDHGRNLATLREQEARLEQIDKENFSLKLKIHFMEDALRKSGKEFNEAAVRENTELKVDKVTLQRDLKQYRKSLSQAEKDLEDYKKQLSDYAGKMKKRHMSEGMQEEMKRLQSHAVEKEATALELQKKLKAAEEDKAQVDELRDEIGDLEAELREKEDQIDARDEEIKDLKDQSSKDDGLDKDLQEKERLLEEKEDELRHIQEDLESLKSSYKRKMEDKDQLLQQKEDDLRNFQEKSAKASGDSQSDVLKKDVIIQGKERRIKELEDAHNQAQAQARSTHLDHLAEIRAKDQIVEEKGNDIQVLQRKLAAADGRDQDNEQLNDEIRALQDKLIGKSRVIEDMQTEIHDLKRSIQTQEDFEDELVKAEDRIHELELEQERNLKEVQSLRDADKGSAKGRQRLLEAAQDNVKELEEQQRLTRQHELQLEKDINKLKDELKAVQSRLDQSSSDYSAERAQLENRCRSADSSRNKAESRVTSLEATINELRETEGDLSGRETRLQKALDNEKVRHESEEDLLRKEIEELIDESEQRRQAIDKAKLELASVKKDLDAGQVQILELQNTIQGLEDEIDVLQITQDEDVDRAKDDVNAAKQEAEGLRRQLRGVQQDMARLRTEKEALERFQDSPRSKGSPKTVPNPQDNLQSKVEELNESLGKLRKERQSLQDDILKLEAAQANAKVENETLHFDLQASFGTGNQLQQKLHDAQGQLIKSNKEKGLLEVSLTTTTANLESLQASLSELESARDAALAASRDLKAQLHTAQREAERKLQTQVAAYERDIDNLEQDLEDAQSQKTDLIQARDSGTTTITRLKNKITSLERDLSNVRAGRTDRETSVEERKDLHDMLKDTKLEAEDLALQIRERDSRITAAAAKEGELRTQLARLRNERAAQAARADSTAEQLARLQSAHDVLASEAADLQARQRSVRFPKSFLTASSSTKTTTNNNNNNNNNNIPPPTPADTAALEKLTKRHAAELRGLVKQIEYLSARLRREESSRADLGFVKRYVSQQVVMHARCTNADLALVDAMGIATRDVLRSQRRGEERARPGLRAVGFMVVAALRIKKRAEGWGAVRKGHEELLKKLVAVRKERDGKGRVEASARDVSGSGAMKGARQRREVF